MTGFGDIFFDFDEEVITEEVNESFNTTPGVIFLVDVRNNMFALDEEMLVQPVILSLQCIRQWIRNFIFASAKCFCSIILVGSGKMRNAVDSKNIYSVLDLKLIDADAIKLIDQLMNLVKEKKFGDEYGSGDFSLADALWISSNMFTELKRKLTKHVILFTNDGCPFPKAQDRVRVFAKIADMKSSKISFQLIPLGASFEYKFYKELLDEMGDGWEDEKFSRVLKLDDAIDRGPKPTPYHVPLANVPFVISEDFSIPIQIHSLVVEVTIPYAVTLSKATNTPVSTKTTFVPEESEEFDEIQEAVTLTKNSIDEEHGKMGCQLRYESVGSECVLFTESEMEEINAVGLRQLQLLGFKPRSTLSLEHHVQPCGFVYPDEKRAKGASQFFQALMESCRKKDVVAICSFCPRPTSTVRYVALDVHVSPPGFLMITLPFGDEVRDTEDECLQSTDSGPTEEQIEIMENVVKKLRVKFDPKNFPNPPLAAYWAGIEALALDLPEQEEIVDASNPDVEQMSQRLGDLTEQFNSSFFPNGLSSNSRAPSRTLKRSDAIADIAAVEENYRNETLHRLTLDQLKLYLKSVGLGIGLSKKKKADLISMVMRYMEKNSVH